jgi:hypothetical protein
VIELQEIVTDLYDTVERLEALMLQQHDLASLATIRDAFATSMAKPRAQDAIILTTLRRHPAMFARTADGLWHARRQQEERADD